MGWMIECVDCPKYFFKMTDRSLRLDANGHPHIAYGDDHLYYAWYDGSIWHFEAADEAPGVGRHASLALDENGYPHISYFDDYNDDLKYAYRDASGWHTQIVNSAWNGNLEGGTSLAMDGNGYAHISYYDDARYSVNYAFQDGNGWHKETIDQFEASWETIVGTRH